MTSPDAAAVAASAGGGGGREADPRQQPQPQPQPAAAQTFLEGFARMFLVFTALQFASQTFFGTPPQPPQPQQGMDSGDGGGTTLKPLGADPTAERFARGREEAAAAAASGGGRGPRPSCLWDPGTTMDLSVYFTDSEEFFDDEFDFDGDGDGSESNGGDGGGGRRAGSAKAVLAEWHESGLTLGGGAAAAAAASRGGSRGTHGAGPGAGTGVIGGGEDERVNGNGNDRAANLTVPLTDAVRNNVTHLYAHVRLRRRQGEGGGGMKRRREDVLAKTIRMTRHEVRKRERDEKSLLGGGGSTEGEGEGAGEGSSQLDPDDASPLTAAALDRTRDQVLLYLKPSLTLQLVDGSAVPQFPDRRSIPPQFSDHMDWLSDLDSDSSSSSSSSSSSYYPILYSSEFWITRSSLRPVNGTRPANDDVTLEVRFEDASLWKWQLMSQMESTWRTQAEVLGEDESSTDAFRTMLLETNPYLLAVTAVVSVLHSVFDFLAFKNDVAFFRGKKSMEGLSVRSMVVNAFFQLVIWLYLADNETSRMILASNGIGLLIELWKISRAIRVSFAHGKLEWKATETYARSTTREYDEIATNHLLYVAMPLVSGYGMYSLTHRKHRGWYSWALNALVGYIYMFGFVMMTPQLFINYKLKSVAHLNWRTMAYKSVNTFIDDLFAFVIRMPIMHRLACLRDDAVFFVFLYQRWIYRTDYSRVNEYGQGGGGRSSDGDGEREPGGMKEEETKELTEGGQGREEEEREDGGGGALEPSSTGATPSDAGTKTGTGTVRRRRGARERRRRGPGPPPSGGGGGAAAPPPGGGGDADDVD